MLAKLKEKVYFTYLRICTKNQTEKTLLQTSSNDIFPKYRSKKEKDTNNMSIINVIWLKINSMAVA